MTIWPAIYCRVCQFLTFCRGCTLSSYSVKHDHCRCADCLRHCCLLQVLIQNGELLTGGLCKKTLGASGGSLIHVIMMEHGPEGARAFLSQCQYLTNHWLLQHGMSIGIGDTVADHATMGAINDTINKVLILPISSCFLNAMSKSQPYITCCA